MAPFIQYKLVQECNFRNEECIFKLPSAKTEKKKKKRSLHLFILTFMYILIITISTNIDHSIFEELFNQTNENE